MTIHQLVHMVILIATAIVDMDTHLAILYHVNIITHTHIPFTAHMVMQNHTTNIAHIIK